MKHPQHWDAYELLDHGNGRKLERFGDIMLDRPEPSAIWKPALGSDVWMQARARFTEEKGQQGFWNHELPDWTLSYLLGDKNLSFHLRPTTFKHVGVFPEQAENWEFIRQRCQRMIREGVAPKVLNLFAYTGGASLAASLSGAEATHVDSVKSVVNWARDNATLSGIDNIRWIVEDARKFVEKAVRRGDIYHGVIMDPPIFGLGPKGNKWKLNRDLPDLLQEVLKILHPEHRFLILNTYSPQLSLTDLNKILQKTPEFPKNYESTTLGLKSTAGKDMPLGNLVRF